MYAVHILTYKLTKNYRSYWRWKW